MKNGSSAHTAEFAASSCLPRNEIGTVQKEDVEEWKPRTRFSSHSFSLPSAANRLRAKMSKLGKSKFHSILKDFQNEGIETDGTLILCTYCDKKIIVDDKHQKLPLSRHVESVTHKKNKEIRTKTKESITKCPFIADAFRQASKKADQVNWFNVDIAAALMESGIPLSKVNHPSLKGFLEKYKQRKIRDESTLRKNYVDVNYDTTILKIKSIIGHSPVAFSLDETIDAQKRFVLSILVAPLNGESSRFMLFKMYHLEKTNNCTVMQAFNDACSKLWPEIHYDKVWLVVTDQASYMLKAFSHLKPLYPNLHHITCLVHSLHRVCEAVREKYEVANQFIGLMKKVLLKAPARINMFQKTTQFALPPEPVTIRWGTWISAVVYYCLNFAKIKDFIAQLEEDGSAAVTKNRSLMGSKDLEKELYEAYNYKFIVDSIKKLEEQNLEKQIQWEIFKEVESRVDDFAKTKLENSLRKNPDVIAFVSENQDLDIRIKIKFAPLVSRYVERSFSQYKDFLTDTRQNMIFQNVEKLCIVRQNYFVWNEKE